MSKTTNIFRKIAVTLAFALVITSFSGIYNANKAQAATTAGNVVYDGNGSLSCGSATLKLENGVLTYTGSTTIKYWANPVAGTMVINQTDRLGHVFWYSGIYFVIDMNTGAIIQAYKNSSNSYCLKSSGNAVYGSSAYMATINTCIIDDEWFYQENMAKMQRLMTRGEFDRISKGEDPTAPTQAPTVAPTTVPTQMPTAVPSQTPSNNCGCKDGGKCTCPAGQCKCDNCNCGPTVSCHPTQKPTVAPTKKPGNNANNSEINVPGNNNTINVNQNISITDTTTNVIGDGNNVGVDVNGGKAAANSTKKKKTTTKVSAKKHARVVTSGKRIKLFTKKNKLHGWLIFNKKTGSLNWNGYHMKGVKTCGFIQKSWNVIVVMKNGTVYKLPKTVKAGKTVHKTRIKCSEAKTLNRDSYGFVKYVKLKCGGVKNVSGK